MHSGTCSLWTQLEFDTSALKYNLKILKKTIRQNQRNVHKRGNSIMIMLTVPMHLKPETYMHTTVLYVPTLHKHKSFPISYYALLLCNVF